MPYYLVHTCNEQKCILVAATQMYQYIAAQGEHMPTRLLIVLAESHAEGTCVNPCCLY